MFSAIFTLFAALVVHKSEAASGMYNQLISLESVTVMFILSIISQLQGHLRF